MVISLSAFAQEVSATWHAFLLPTDANPQSSACSSLTYSGQPSSMSKFLALLVPAQRALVSAVLSPSASTKP